MAARGQSHDMKPNIPPRVNPGVEKPCPRRRGILANHLHDRSTLLEGGSTTRRRSDSTSSEDGVSATLRIGGVALGNSHQHATTFSPDRRSAREERLWNAKKVLKEARNRPASTAAITGPRTKHGSAGGRSYLYHSQARFFKGPQTRGA